MSEYRYGSWYCKPANEAEAKEIVERAIASGARNYASWAYDARCYGVLDGVVGTYDSGIEYTIKQVRKLFPLPDEQSHSIPLPGRIYYRKNGKWYPSTAYGQVVDHTIARTEGNGNDEYADEDVRPIRSEWERWVEQALEHFCDDDGAETMERIYDAFKSGDLKAPGVE